MDMHSLFLTGLDTRYREKEMMTIQQTRAYIAMHALFAEQLVMSDTQILRHEHLCALMNDYCSGIDLPSNLPRDLDVLLGHGCLIPLIRDTAISLSEVHGELIRKKLPRVLSDRYCKFLEERLGDQWNTYDLGFVADQFRERALLSLSSNTAPIRKSIQEKARSYVAEYKGRVDYWRFNEWLDKQYQGGSIDAIENDYLYEQMRDAYRFNVPWSLGLVVDQPKVSLDWPVQIMSGDNEEFEVEKKMVHISPVIFLSDEQLSIIPSEVLLEVRGTEHFREVLKQLKILRVGGEIDMNDVAKFITLYCAHVDSVLSDSLAGDAKKRYKERRQKATDEVEIRYRRSQIYKSLELAVPYGGRARSLLSLGWAKFQNPENIKKAVLQLDYLQGRVDAQNTKSILIGTIPEI